MIDVVAKTLAWLALLAVCLLLPAESIDWPTGWAVLGCYAGVVLAAFVVVDHELLAERAHPKRDSEPLDALIGGAAAVLLYPASLIVAGLDHANGWTLGLPSRVSTAALALFVAGYALGLWAMHANRFFTTFVRIQNDRQHHVVSTGPYAWVRHPGYAGTILAHLAMPIALESWWALAPAAAGCLLLAVRSIVEEGTLTAKLEGYADYRQRVRQRLLPGVW